MHTKFLTAEGAEGAENLNFDLSSALSAFSAVSSTVSGRVCSACQKALLQTNGRVCCAYQFFCSEQLFYFFISVASVSTVAVYGARSVSQLSANAARSRKLTLASWLISAAEYLRRYG